MMNPTSIEWVSVPAIGDRPPLPGFTWNPMPGCTRGCEGCYAHALRGRLGSACDCWPQKSNPDHVAAELDWTKTLCGNFFPHLHEDRLDQPAERRSAASVFVDSVGDLFDPHVPFSWRERVYRAMLDAPIHTYWILTKRPDLVTAEDIRCLANLNSVALGVSISWQRDFDRHVDLYRAVNAALTYPVRLPLIISAEPLREGIDLDLAAMAMLGGMLDWLIVGCMTGAKAKTCAPDEKDVAQLVAQAKTARVPVFVKDNARALMGDKFVDAHRQWPTPIIWSEDPRGRNGGDRT